MQNNQPNLPVLIVAPFGRDASLIAETLRQANIDSEPVSDARAALRRLSNGTGVLLLEEEALDDGLIHDFATAFQNQPPWSDSSC